MQAQIENLPDSMRVKQTALYSDLILLVAIGVISFSLISRGFTLSSSEMGLEIHVHDTYIVIKGWTTGIPVFFAIVFMVYLLKESRHKFIRPLRNGIIVISGWILCVVLTFVSNLFTRYSYLNENGWKSYPPETNIPPSGKIATDHFFEIASNVVILLQAGIIICLLIVVFLWGRSMQGNLQGTPANKIV